MVGREFGRGRKGGGGGGGGAGWGGGGGGRGGGVGEGEGGEISEVGVPGGVSGVLGSVVWRRYGASGLAEDEGAL